MRDVHPVPWADACGVAPAAFNDHTCLVAGTRPDLQRAEGKHQGKRSGHLRVSRLSRLAVGEDQVAHIELTREIARRFNQFYSLTRQQRASFPAPLGPAHPLYGHYAIFPEPAALLTPAPRLPGTDGRKMSKSYGNALLLTDPEPVVRQK